MSAAVRGSGLKSQASYPMSTHVQASWEETVKNQRRLEVARGSVNCLTTAMPLTLKRRGSASGILGMRLHL